MTCRVGGLRTLVGVPVMMIGLVAGCGTDVPASTNGNTGDPETSSQATNPVDQIDASTSSPHAADPGNAGADLEAALVGDGPPPVVVIGGGRTLELDAWTTCWTPLADDGGVAGGYCADGAPPDDPELIESDEPLSVVFPIDTWKFSATVDQAAGWTEVTSDSGGECGRTQTEVLEPLGDGSWRLPLIGPAGDQIVTLSGGGPGGDVFVTFRWRTTLEGVLPVPDASVTVLADHDGELDSYGVELVVNDLSHTPPDAAATITVTSASGVSRVIEPTPEDLGCTSEGHLFFRAGAADGRLDADLADGPFTYAIAVTLDGVVHRATAIWPDEQVEECAPCVPLDFEPTLPALQSTN